ncbi:LacI family DNA-binding transcriptional regulator [Candidatus Pantoea multigeneris]|uniref:LacI family transcriptional regulator n=1 Tax=Candidatus Pantoea multigeneris TaxID=2608357 RepID=A0ABX0RBI4_9GAMM|nr:LacI family DNA-binding transcriptional regulator [Pantoea multigeneris]NIF22710.1 LacI family transcriptional regulator [Pantoea multigeneris]
MSKITMTAIAEAAGVGVATVDRVLNRRAPVRAETEQKVLSAASRLGYRMGQSQLLTQGKPLQQNPLSMGFILLPPTYSFYATLSEALARETQEFHPVGVEPQFRYHDLNDVEGVAASLHALAASVDVIALVALDHPLIRHAIEAISRSGVKVYALFSDFSPCGHAGYFGIDNQKGGRTAGWFAHHLALPPGPFAVLVGDHRFTCQESSEISFRSYLREHDASRQVLEPLKTHESIEGGYQATLQLLRDYPDLALIFAPCGGIEGVIRALRSQPERKVAVISHGPVKEGDLALIDGTISVMLRHRIDNLAETIASTLQLQHLSDSQHFIKVVLPFDVVTRENL